MKNMMLPLVALVGLFCLQAALARPGPGGAEMTGDRAQQAIDLFIQDNDRATKNSTKGEEQEASFRALDTNRDGKLTKSDLVDNLKGRIGNITSEEEKKVIEHADNIFKIMANGKEVITLKDYQEGMKKAREESSRLMGGKDSPPPKN